jgi:hypothetical protein
LRETVHPVECTAEGFDEALTHEVGTIPTFAAVVLVDWVSQVLLFAAPVLCVLHGGVPVIQHRERGRCGRRDAEENK